MNPNTVPHHIIAVGSGAMGSKSGDENTMALCIECHSAIHADKNSFDQLLHLHRTRQKAISEGVISIVWNG